MGQGGRPASSTGCQAGRQPGHRGAGREGPWSYLKGEVKEDEVGTFFLFEDLEIVVQSAVLVNSGKSGSGLRRLELPAQELPPAPTAPPRG